MLVAGVQLVVDIKTQQMGEVECQVAFKLLGSVRGKHKARIPVVRVDALRWGFLLVMALRISRFGMRDFFDLGGKID